MNNWESNPILPFTRIIAGCRSSDHLSRVLLYPVLQKMHDDFIPKQVHFRCFVDDLVLKVCEGSDAATLSTFVDSFHHVITDLGTRRLSVRVRFGSVLARPGPARPGPTRPGLARPGPARPGPARPGPAPRVCDLAALLVSEKKKNSRLVGPRR